MASLLVRLQKMASSRIKVCHHQLLDIPACLFLMKIKSVTKAARWLSVEMYSYLLLQKSPQQGYLDLTSVRVPGPGTYNMDRLAKGTQYSIRTRTRLLDKKMTLDPQNNNPGPGEYEDPEALSSKGKYSVSKHHGVGAPILSSKSPKRFSDFSKCLK
jgi:hypothetical protein